MPEPFFVLTVHAEAVMRERGIQLAWVDRVLHGPHIETIDEHDTALRHALGRIQERDGRVLRVVYNPSQEPWSVVTAYFDRGQRDKV